MGGALVAGSPPRVRTDAAAWEQNPGWLAAPGSHVLSPLDAGFDERGACVFIPHCPSRLLSLLENRSDLSAGEVVTVAVSVLRGAAEAYGLGAENGVWWVTAEGRPVVATTGESPWSDEAVEVLTRVAEVSEVLAPDVLLRATTAITDPRRLRRDVAELEDVLFLAADPLPLVTETVTPRSRTASSLPRRAPIEAAPRGRIVVDVLRRHVDTGWSERVGEVLASLRVPASRRAARDADRHSDRSDVRPRGMRRPAILGCAAAAAVLAVGLSWPDPPHDDAAAHDRPASSAAPIGRASDNAPATGPAVPSPSSSPTQMGEKRVTRVAADLLDDLAACAERGCDARVVEQPGRRFPPGPATALGIDRRVEIIDDYGGVVAMRVSAAHRAQIAVMVQSGHKWLVRDIYDVADQPD